MFEDQKPEIEYPCIWEYRIIGSDSEAITSAISDIMGNRDYSIKEGNKSKTGKYVSFNLETFVNDEEYRISLFHQLKEHSDITMVL